MLVLHLQKLYFCVCVKLHVKLSSLQYKNTNLTVNLLSNLLVAAATCVCRTSKADFHLPALSLCYYYFFFLIDCCKDMRKKPQKIIV